MNKYNYEAEVANDIQRWMDDNSFDLSSFSDVDEVAEYLFNELWAEDCITGNGPNGYADEYSCEEYLCHNLDLLLEAIQELDIMSDPFRLRSYIDNHRLARYLDCTIRCYLLDKIIYNILNDIWKE